MITVRKPSATLDEGIKVMIEAMIEDYNAFTANEQMQDKFANGFDIRKGRKYIKVIHDHSVWAFIVKDDPFPMLVTKKDDSGYFRCGDILKPAGWSAPARNKARGNVLDGGYRVQWTGPLYLFPHDRQHNKELMANYIKLNYGG